jgi:DNA-binding transcriptional MocR family regulator
MMDAGLNPSGLPLRLRQEHAAHQALREGAIRDLEKLIKRADRQREIARRWMQKYGPKLHKWAEAGMPPDAKMERLAQRYMKATEAAHEAEVAMSVAEKALSERPGGEG